MSKLKIVDSLPVTDNKTVHSLNKNRLQFYIGS